MDKASKEFENQSKSIESLLMRVINEYQISKNVSTDLSKRIKNLNEHMTKSVQLYDQGL